MGFVRKTRDNKHSVCLCFCPSTLCSSPSARLAARPLTGQSVRQGKARCEPWIQARLVCEPALSCFRAPFSSVTSRLCMAWPLEQLMMAEPAETRIHCSTCQCKSLGVRWRTLLYWNLVPKSLKLRLEPQLHSPQSLRGSKIRRERPQVSWPCPPRIWPPSLIARPPKFAWPHICKYKAQRRKPPT